MKSKYLTTTFYIANLLYILGFVMSLLLRFSLGESNERFEQAVIPIRLIQSSILRKASKFI